MPNQSGVWTLSQQFQARGQGLWPAPPGAPTIGTATAGSALCASVTFTAPACTGYPAGITSYTVTSTPGCLTKTGASSPLVVTGLTNGTSYTFKVKATGTSGLTSLCSAASNSITASNAGQQAYTSAGTYSWVAPAGVTSVSVVAVGGGGNGQTDCFANAYGYAGGGGGLGYKNNISVTPGNSYTVVVGGAAGSSYFVNACTVAGLGGKSATTSASGAGGSYVGDGGGSGGKGGTNGRGVGAGGAGGYAGNGGNGGKGCVGNVCCALGTAGAGGGGGGGSGGTYNTSFTKTTGGGGGGGVGILGQGSNGAANKGTRTSNWSIAAGGGGGSGGASGGSSSDSTGIAGNGGAYGGGGGGGGNTLACPFVTPAAGTGAGGAVRIIWPGNTRSFPSTCTGDK